METRGLDQRRAADALACVQEVMAKGDRDFRSLYRSYVERLASAIVMNGLGQALATELTEAGPGDSKGLGTGGEGALPTLSEFEPVALPTGRGVYPGASDVLTAMMAPPASLPAHRPRRLPGSKWHRSSARRPPGGRRCDV